MRMTDDFAQRQQRSARNTGLDELRADRGAVERCEGCFEGLLEFGSMRAARWIAEETRIACNGRDFQFMAKLTELSVIADGDENGRGCGAKGIVRRDIGMSVASS